MPDYDGPVPPRLRGRQPQVDVLRGQLDALGAGRGGVVLLSGPPILTQDLYGKDVTLRFLGEATRTIAVRPGLATRRPRDGDCQWEQT